MRKRKSYNLGILKRELHKRALQETDEDKRKDYWRMYFKAQHAENEVSEMVLEAENRRLIEFLRAEGWSEEILDKPEEEEESSSENPHDKPIDDDDIPPRQKGLWDDQ